MESKKDIRRRILTERRLMEQKEWEEKSHRITEAVTAHPFFLCAERIFCYLDHEQEVGTREIIERAWSLGKQVALPKVTGSDMEFYDIHSFSEVKEGYKGILEPVTDRIVERKEGLMIVPGVVFDKTRNRIGYGKGFYDRYLSQYGNPQLKTIAVGFELQVMEEIPSEPTDYRPEVLITEENIYV